MRILLESRTLTVGAFRFAGRSAGGQGEVVGQGRMAGAVVVLGEPALLDERLVQVGVVLRSKDLICRLVLLNEQNDVLVRRTRRVAKATERALFRNRGGGPGSRKPGIGRAGVGRTGRRATGNKKRAEQGGKGGKQTHLRIW